MKSIFKILFILTTCALLIHATNQRCTSCGNLGEGKNPCTCSDVVVKAAQLPKPTYYALPQQINEAAAARRGISLSTSQSTISSSAQVDSNSTPCSSSSLSIDSNADIVINGKSDSTSYSSSSSSDTSGSIVAYDNVATVTDTITESQSGGCGCSKQTIETVEIDDSQSSNGEIVPSFPPIGDLCYPLPVDSRTGKIIEKTTKVVPAYPGKIVCQNCMSSRTTPYQVCINSLTGEILSTKIISSSSDATSESGTLIYENSNSAITGLDALSIPSETISKSRTLIYGNSNPTISGLGALSSPLDATSKSGTLIYGNSNSAISGLGALSSPSETISKSRTLIYGNSNPTISASGPFIQIAPGKNGVVSQSRSFSGPRVTLHKNANSGVFGGASSTPYKLPLVYANLNSPNRQKQRSRITLSRSSSDCFDDSATTGGTEVDYSYPAIPADAVSLTLAYKNLRAPNVIYRQGKQFIPEDKLSFGHRTVPNEVKTQTKISNIPEEKLVTVDRPVVELKVAPARTVVIGSYDEREEAKLAELEAFERESITQEENVDRVSESLLTYKDLGYAPVGSTYTQFAKYNGAVSYNGEMSDSGEAPCGPLGPPLSDYVPGRVVVQQEVVQDNAETSFNGGINESMEIIQSSRSGSCPT